MVSTDSYRVALIDADVIAYQAAFKAEFPLDWGNGLWTMHANEGDVESFIVDEIESTIERCKASAAVLALSDRGSNFRKRIYPPYKANRDNQRKPMLLHHAREYMKTHWETWERQHLEADDVVGILATSNKLYRKNSVIVSIDKDLSQIPGRHLRHDKENDKYWIEQISQAYGDELHLVQTLAGDQVDNYPGCPGVGEVTAWKIISDPRVLEYQERPKKTGKNKGEIVGVWEDMGPADTIWEGILYQFFRAGLTPQDALEQAQVAKILRAENYDFRAKQPIPWYPEQ